jgi:hypothetical protein
MSSSPTYYDLFGVRQNASFEEIRSAYLWLMKQHHPDRSDHADRQRSADFAAMVNRCYAVLKDPSTRARYDAWLAREAGQSGNTKVRRALLTGSTRRKRETKWDATSKAAAALAGLVVLLVAGVVWLPKGSPMRNSDTIAAGVAYSSGDTPAAVPGAADIRTQVRLAMSTTADQAERVSERCFALAGDAQSLARIRSCIIFDDAFLEWNRTSSDAPPRTVYFDDSIVRLRHQDALRVIGSFDDAQLDLLRQASVNAMLAEIKSKVNVAPEADGSAGTVDIRDKMSR